MPKNNPRKPIDQGSYPGAHPDAPGGMSIKALAAELRRDTTFDTKYIGALTWPELIHHVCESRLAVEQAAKAAALLVPTGWTTTRPMTEHDVVLDVEQEVADLAAARAAHEAEQAASQPASLFLGMPDTLDFRFDNHAGAGPSGAERWMTCTASLGAARAFLETLSPNQQAQFARSGDAARQGTTAHAAAEVEVGVMMGTVTPEEAEQTLLELTIMPETEGEAYDSEMAEHIAEYTDLVQTYLDAGHTVLVEQRVEAAVPLVGLHEDEVHVITGSGDTIALPTRVDPVLTVIDLKYGNGIDVEVDENSQCRIYALGALSLLADEEGNLPDIERVDLIIVQPRLGGIKTWSESVEELLTWRDEVLAPALTAALYGQDNLPEHQSTYTPSETACQWCPARGGCAALAEQRVDTARDLFDAVVEAEFAGHDISTGFPETGALTNERLGLLLAQVEGLIQIKDDLKDEAQRRLHRGDTVPGYQLVSYTPPRKWVDGALEDLEGLVQEGEVPPLYKPKALLTPKQALTLMGEDAAKIEDLIDTPDKRPVVAKDGDRRKPWTGTPPEQMFPSDKTDEDVA